MITLRRSLIIPFLFPCNRPGLWIKRKEPGIPLSHQGNDQVFAGKNGRSSEIPVQSILSIGGQILFPDNLSIKIEACQVATLKQGLKILTFRYHRWITSRAIQVAPLSLRPDFSLPVFLSTHGETKDRILPVDRTGQKDGIFPHDGCGTSFIRQRSFPQKIFFMVQFGRIISVGGRTGGILPSPRRPITCKRTVHG